MPETGAAGPESPKPPRFPLGPALLFAACIGMAAWTWMRYSYCWRMTPDEAVRSVDGIQAGRWPADAYVELDCGEQVASTAEVSSYDPGWRVGFRGFPAEGAFQFRRGRWSPWIPSVGITGTYGTPQGYQVLTLDAAGRFHGASVAGLVVAAFGGFIFALHLRQWMIGRKAHGRPGADAEA